LFWQTDRRGPKQPLWAFLVLVPADISGSLRRRACVRFVVANGRAAVVDDVLLKQIQCRHCGRIFYVCWRCWRGQLYCADACRQLSRRQSHLEAQRRYRQTDRGREAHREAERKRRMKENEKIVDDEGSTPRKACGRRGRSWPENTVRCRFCGLAGTVVAQFPRRGYVARRFPGQIVPGGCSRKEVRDGRKSSPTS